MQLPSDETQAVWVALMRIGPLVLDKVSAAVKEAGYLSLEAYDVLWGIERAPGGEVRPHELADQLLFPRYGLSRLLAKLEEDGLIERRECPQDARGHLISLTPAGKRLRARMWPVYGAAMKEAVQDKLTPAEAKTLARLLGKLG
jgi:DNA-binding MarR family transcriptional regulator